MSRRPVAVLTAVLAAALLCACAGAGLDRSPARTANADGDAARHSAPSGVVAERRQRAALHADLAASYLLAGRADTARDEAVRATEIDAGLPAAWHQRALAELGLDRPVEAERSFVAALSAATAAGVAPDADLLNNYGWLLCQQGRHDEAMPALRRAVSSSAGGPARPLTTLGACQLRQGDTAAARVSFGEALRHTPDHAIAATALAGLDYRQGDLAAASRALQPVNRGPQASAASLWLAARIAHRQGDADAQAASIAQLRERFPAARELTAYEQGAWDE